jgi:predicted transposase/invertase (TIGR01784 family)
MKKNKAIGRYMDLKTDFTFKYVFVNEDDKSIVINLLNEILKGRCIVADVEYLLPEQLGRSKKERKAFFDLYCRNERNERIVIEMQVAWHENFIDRCLFYLTFPIQKQAIKGEEWDYHLDPVFFIAIKAFSLLVDNPNYINYHLLMNEETHEILSDKIQLVTIELGKFNKTEAELETNLDYWMYCFKNAQKLKEQPKIIQGDIFNKLFNRIDTKNLTDNDMETYNKSIMEYADVRFIAASNRKMGYNEGMEKGMESQNVQIAKNMIKKGISLELISEITSLTPAQIQQIKI